MNTPTTKKAPVATDNGGGALFAKFCQETGLSPQNLAFRTTPGKNALPRDSFLFYEKSGNVHIPYYDIDGVPVQFPKGKKLLDFERVRLAAPEPGKGKYRQPVKSGNFPYFTPGIIEKYQQQTPTPLLFFTEGEKKALAGWHKLGVDIVSLPGIHGAKDTERTNELHQDVQKLIKRCNVKTIVLLLDADSRTSGFNPDKPDKDLYLRAFSFFRSVAKLKELLHPFQIDLYFSHINPELELEPKGLDDLLLLYPAKVDEVKAELLSLAVGQKEYAKWFNVTANSDSKLKEFFGVDSAATFYELYRNEINDNAFIWRRGKYEFRSDRLHRIKPEVTNSIWWYPETDKSGSVTGVKIDHLKFVRFLEELGYRRFDVGPNYLFIQIQDNLISEVNITQMQDQIISWISDKDDILSGDVPKNDLLQKIYSSPQIYFSEKKLSLLKTEELQVNRDTINTSFVYFRNGYVQITADNVTFKPYGDLPGYLYRNQRQDRDFDIVSEECNFKQFVFNVCGKDEDRFHSMRTIIGYILHDFYHYKRRAINFTDSTISDTDEGRTGKTLLMRACGKLKNYTEIPGKNFRYDERFRFAKCDLDTQIVHINDARRNFNLELLFNSITDGIDVEKKNQQPFSIDAKVVISSNKTLKVEGSSARDRIIEFELSGHYSDKKTPEDDFGEWFFRDWEDSDWYSFDNFMVNCIHLFLKEGDIVRPALINIHERKLREETSPDFVEYMDDKVHEILGYKAGKAETHDDFIKQYPDYDGDKFLGKQKHFTGALKKYALYRNYNFQEGKSGSERWFIIGQENQNATESDAPPF